MNNVVFSKVNQSWETPKELFERLDAEHHFDLDVCALPHNAKCQKFFTPEDDGLKQEWRGVCWCNPPYGKQIAEWVKKAAEAKCKTVMLLPVRTDTAWFHDYVLPLGKVEFIRKRLRFEGANNPAPFPSMIVIFDNRGEE